MISRMILLAIGMLLVAACNDATAEDKEQPKQVMRAECLALQDKTEKVACLKKVLEQSREKRAQGEQELAREKAKGGLLDRQNEALLDKLEEEVLETTPPK